MILEALFNGEIYPGEQVVPKTPEYRAELKNASELMELLSRRLSKEDIAAVEQLRKHLSSSDYIENEAHFKYGFSVGLFVMVEALEQLSLLHTD